MISTVIACGFEPEELIITLIVFILIPAIIIETILLKYILRKSWGESFEVSIVANVASLIAGALFISIFLGILSLTRNLFTLEKIITILCPISTLALIIYIEKIVAQKYWKNISGRKLLKAIITAKIITCGIFVMIGCFLPPIGQAREPARRISCIANLKQIGLALKSYADDYNGHFPDKGLEQLRINDYLTDYGVYNCPSTNTRKGKDNEKLTDAIVDYVYQKGLKFNIGAQNSKIPIAWDKAENHVGYGNVLLLDGHVKGFETSNGIAWMEQAGITEAKK